MDLLFSCQSTPLHVTGGSERVTWQTCVGMAQRGHKVAVLTTNLPGLTGPKMLEGVEVHPVPTARPAALDRDWWPKSRAYAEEHGLLDVDAVISAAVSGGRLPLRGATRLIAHCQDVRLHEKGKAAGGRAVTDWSALNRWDLAYVARECALLRKADRIVIGGPNPFLALRRFPYALAASPSRTVAIPNGIDGTRFHPSERGRLARRQAWGVGPDHPVILVVSRLHEKKGLQRALEVFADFRRKFKTGTLFIVGTGPEEALLPQRIADLGLTGSVHPVGFVPEQDLPSYYQAADAFLFTPRGSEGHPLNVLEALGCGLPVVVPSHVRDASHPTARVHAADYDDVEGLAEALRSAIAGGRDVADPEGPTRLPRPLTTQGYMESFAKVVERPELDSRLT